MLSSIAGREYRKKMASILKAYKSAIVKYPLRAQAVQAGILMAAGDQLAQNFIEKRKFQDIDFVRTSQFLAIGVFIGGPCTRTWYGILDRFFGSKGTTVALKKVACDQILFAPCFVAVLLTCIGVMQGNNFDSVKMKLHNEFSDILINNWKLWPIVQLVNFSLTPLQYQVLVVQVVAIFWNSYVSYRTNRDASA